MAQKIADVLNRPDASDSVNKETFFQFAVDFFDNDDIDSVVSSDEDDCSEGEEDSVLECLHLPAAPDYEAVIKELQNAEELLALVDKSNKPDDDDIDSDSDSDEDTTHTPTVVVDQVKPILNSLTNLFVSSSVEVERTKIVDFNCGCKLSEQGQCFKQFSTDYVHRLRMDLTALTPKEKDMFIMGKISCHINLSTKTSCTKRKTQTERKRNRTTFMIENKVICRDTFKFMHCIGNERLKRIIQTYTDGHVEPIEKKSGGRVESPRTLTFEDVKRIVNFLTTFAEAHAMILPGRIPGFKRDDVKLLPSHETKRSVWRQYTTAMEETGHRAAKLTSFKNIWSRLLPFIVRVKPMSDLCWACQKNNGEVFRSANLPEIVKQAKLKKQYAHLELVAQERTLYREMMKEAKENAGENRLEPNLPCSKEITMHYSFDFAQQVHIPSNPLQPGPIYFLVPRKCGIFGVACEGVTQQVNYLIDEGMSSSKGSNAVISYLHHFFENFGLGETDAHLHCDNCSGQNKNKFLVWYFLWRTLHGLHRRVSVNFMIAGHTKFAPDQCFGLLKQQFRRTEISSLEEMADCVTKSSPVQGVNIPQLVGDEAGNIFVPQYDWQKFLTNYFKALDGIKKQQHIRVDRDHPGTVFVKETPTGVERSLQLLKNTDIHPPPTLPDMVAPSGLDKKRKWYLFTKIREFCSEATRDIVCPRPPGLEENVELSDDENYQPAKRQKKTFKKTEE